MNGMAVTVHLCKARGADVRRHIHSAETKPGTLDDRCYAHCSWNGFFKVKGVCIPLYDRCFVHYSGCGGWHSHARRMGGHVMEELAG